MGNAAGQSAKSFHFLRLLKLCFEPLLVRHIEECRKYKFFACDPNEFSEHDYVENRAVLGFGVDLQSVNFL